MSSPRLSIARRPLLDLPVAVSTSAAQAAAPASPAARPAAPNLAADLDTLRIAPATKKTAVDHDFDLSSTFDVPAFLRRQES
jgi:hypothetical protein